MRRAIQSVFDGSGLNPIHGAKSLDDQIGQIRRAKFGIYELSTSEKSETLLELGIAIGLGKEITLICKRGSSLPENIRKLPRIEFENLSDLTEKLKKNRAS